MPIYITVSLILSSFWGTVEAQPDSLIVGTWKSNSGEVELVFTDDGLQKDYIDGELIATYNWTICEAATPSGLTMHELILTNIENADDQQNFLIDTLTDERLILVYNTGVGLSRSTYMRQ
jgi:hypothetical protein